MKVDINLDSGFCSGVINALKALDKIIEEKKYSNIYYFEEIVHNDQVIEKYNNLGCKKISINDLSNIDKTNSIIILSAHGTSNKLKSKLSGYNYIDTTCPFVKHNQKLAKEAKNLVYIGSINHAESIATYEDISSPILIDSINNYKIINTNDITVINQTTFNMDELKAIHDKIIENCKDAKIINTLCPTTVKNQSSVKDSSYSILLAVGSKKSNNLNTLFNISTIKNKYIIESINDLNNIEFNDKDKVLIVGSASTPKEELFKIKETITKRIL